MIDKVKAFVESECRKPESKYGYEPFVFHFTPVVRYAETLSDELGGDKEAIIIAAWLHDIGSIVYGREDHHITGARIAEEFLKQHDYPKVELVTRCILNHRGSKDNDRHSIEEKIVAEADVLSAFESLPGLFKAAYHEGLTQEEARESVRQKLINKWRQLHFERSREIIRPKYEAAMLLLKQ